MTSKEWNDHKYAELGYNAQRSYPNEELVRYLARNEMPSKHVLDVGSGNGVHIGTIRQFGAIATGIDNSNIHNVVPGVLYEDVREMSFKDDTFDYAVDCFSMYAMHMEDYKKAMKECYRVLKEGGGMFIFTPSTRSTIFAECKNKIDTFTLNGVTEGSFYKGNDYPFRFMSKLTLVDLLKEIGFNVLSLERVSRTKKGEYFEWLVVDVIK